MRIAILGAGNVGSALGVGWNRNGHTIRYGVRDPNDGKHDAAARAARASLHPVEVAIEDAEVIVLAVHWNAVDDVLARCGDLSGRTIIDATNPLVFSEAGMSLAFGFDTSAAEKIAQKVTGAKVVKALNHVGAAVMENAHRHATRPVMFVASDHQDAKETVRALVAELGFDAQDGGALKEARLLEPLAMLWINQVYGRGASPVSAFSFAAGPQSAE